MRELVRVRRMCPGDVPILLLNMRREDALECIACGYTPLNALHDTIQASTEVYAADYAGKLLGCFGVIPHEESTKEKPITTIWVLTTVAVNEHPRAFYRASKDIVKIFAAKHGNLTNFVHAPYLKSRNWLRHLGFVENGVVTSPRGDMFVLVVRPATGFEITKKNEEV